MSEEDFFSPDPAVVAGRRESLLEWYREHRRDLPWRRDRDPYRVLVSEIMLQQTRVETVLRYYRSFLDRFPDFAALAAATEEQVLAHWSGLGYYRRARNLRQAAIAITERGSVPTTAQEWQQLPGIGAYTAAAVASIAFGEAVPVLDGNVERVVARLLALEESPKRKAGREAVLRAAGLLLDPEAAGDSNQALMELGATICVPRRPRCLLCPLGEDCRARREGDPEAWPRRSARREPVVERWTIAVVEREGRWLLARRPADEELLPGMWEFPTVMIDTSSGDEERGRDERRSEGLSSRYGGRWSLARALGEVRHGITFRAIRADVRRACVVDEGAVAEGAGIELRWWSREEIEQLPRSALVDKVLALLAGPRSRR